jgi:hypothetical protein
MLSVVMCLPAESPSADEEKRSEQKDSGMEGETKEEESKEATRPN